MNNVKTDRLVSVVVPALGLFVAWIASMPAAVTGAALSTSGGYGTCENLVDPQPKCASQTNHTCTIDYNKCDGKPGEDCNKSSTDVACQTTQSCKYTLNETCGAKFPL